MRTSFSILSFLILAGCNNLMDADLTQRATFIKLYNGEFSAKAIAMDTLPDKSGYIVLGSLDDLDPVYPIVFKVDNSGNRTSKIVSYTNLLGFTAKSIKTLPDNLGYLIVGERRKRNNQSLNIDNIDIYDAVILRVNDNLEESGTFVRSDPNTDLDNVASVDYRASGITITPLKEILILGTYQNKNTDPQRPYLQLFSTNLQSPPLWTQDFASEIRSYKHAKSIHYNNGSIIWSSAIAVEQGGVNYSYVTVPRVQEGSVFINNSQIGQNNELFQPEDIQPANNIAFGYGVVGSRSDANSTNSNMFFLRVDASGNITERKFYDAVLTANDTEVTSADSEVQDYGTAITSTSDGGYVLAGHFITSNGTSDILLIKIDVAANKVWLQTIGGTGSESVTSIRESEDRGLVILGTHVIGGVSSIFIIKTDKNGELKN